MKKSLLTVLALSSWLLATAQTDGIISTTPDGTRKLYEKLSVGTYYALETAWRYYPEEFATTVVWGSDDEAYLYNVCALANERTYVKATVDGDKLTVSLPQPVYFDPKTGELVNLVMLKAHDYEENGGPAMEYLVDETISSVIYNIEEDGTLNLQLPGEPYSFELDELTDYALGYAFAESGEWTGYADCLQKLTPYEGSFLEVPDGLEYEEYSFVYDNYGIVTNVAFSDNKVYVKGLNPNIPNAVFMGEIRDGKAFVPQNQIIDIYDNCFMYTKCVYDNPDYDIYDEFSPEYLLAPENEEFVFNLEDNNHILSNTDSEMYLCFNGAYDRVYSLSAYRNFDLAYIDTWAGIPKNPFDPYFYDGDYATMGSSAFWFSVPNVTAENALLNVDDLYYRIFINEEPVTFVQTENDPGQRPAIKYLGITEPTELIPFSFDNIIDIIAIADVPRHCVYLYDNVNEIFKVGVQQIYLYNGVRTESDIMTLELSTNKVTYTPGNNDDSGVGFNLKEGEYKIFSINGGKLLETKDPSRILELPRGLYIINGKKVVL